MVATDFEREARLAIKQWSMELERLREREKGLAAEIRGIQEKMGDMERSIRNYRELPQPSCRT